jgi:alginate O-acetyltransferase complex protein AlgI
MVFSSHLFLFYFLPLTLGVYYCLPRQARHLSLTLLSYVFYGWANPWFATLMVFQTVVDFACGLIIARSRGANATEGLLERGSRTRTQKIALATAICSNLALLAFFKYFNFGIDSYNGLVEMLGLQALRLDIWYKITLPLGISFYTFQSMSYAIDVYRGDARVIRRFSDYACYVAMFPQLVAGPIIRFQDVADQFVERTHTLEKFSRGVAFVALGLGKKVLLANPCGKIADTCFSAGALPTPDAWYGVLAYAFQIYFDFCGYSDMAIGLGLMLGFVFAKNFDAPYRSQSITEFWRRWHLSLSTWLRDNLYIPLGGSRRGEVRTYLNLAITMLLGGLWHGASWNFVIWGGLHGAFLAAERRTGSILPPRIAPRWLRVAATFLLVLVTWVFFRARDLSVAGAYLGAMAGLGGAPAGAGLVAGLIYKPYYVLCMLTAAFVVWNTPQAWDFTRHMTWPKLVWVLAVLVTSILVLTTQSFNPFIYFIF